MGGTELCNDTNFAFVHSYIGDDYTGDGTHLHPFKTFAKAKTVSQFILFRGVLNEYYTGGYVSGDDINQVVIFSNYGGSVNQISNCTTDVYPYNCKPLNIIVTGTSTYTNQTDPDNKSYTFFDGVTRDFPGYWGGSSSNNCTLGGYDYGSSNANYLSGGYVANIDSIIIKSFNITDYSTRLLTYPAVSWQNKYCVFPSDCRFSFAGTPIAQPIWTNDSKANMQLLRNSYLAAGCPDSVMNQVFYVDSFGNDTCKIVLEQRNGGTNPNIFNGYNSDGSVADFSLNPDSANEALYASSAGSYVGFYKPALPMTFGNVINVNTDGSDDTAAGTLMLLSDNDLSFSTTSSQTWNRVRDITTIFVKNGFKLKGAGCIVDDGSPFGFFFGKYQNLVDPTALGESAALEVNTLYKVCNSAKNIANAILYNGVQYLPDYFFFTNSSVMNFTLMNEGNGTVVKKVLADVMMSVEIQPYDNLTTPSTSFPRFSMPLFGDLQMLYYKAGNAYGKTAGTTVLFGDTQVITDKIAYYDAWAITNADQEFITLVADTTNYYADAVTLQYFRREINGHYCADYDQ
jgi:hypothetical protein